MYLSSRFGLRADVRPLLKDGQRLVLKVGSGLYARPILNLMKSVPELEVLNRFYAWEILGFHFNCSPCFMYLCFPRSLLSPVLVTTKLDLN